MRDNCNTEELWAHQVLDAVRAGLPMPVYEIKRALWILGDCVGEQ